MGRKRAARKKAEPEVEKLRKVEWRPFRVPNGAASVSFGGDSYPIRAGYAWLPLEHANEARRLGYSLVRGPWGEVPR